jgi:hypothetical protein
VGIFVVKSVRKFPEGESEGRVNVPTQAKTGLEWAAVRQLYWSVVPTRRKPRRVGQPQLLGANGIKDGPAPKRRLSKKLSITVGATGGQRAGSHVRILNFWQHREKGCPTRRALRRVGTTGLDHWSQTRLDVL